MAGLNGAHSLAHLSASHGMHDLVEHALEAGDISQLVRLCFDAQPTDAAPPPPPRDGESAATGGGETREDSPLEAVLTALEEVAEDREAEIQQICRTHAVEIASAMQELGVMQRQSATLRQQLHAHNGTLQEAGQGLVGQLEELHGITQVQAALADARQAVSTVTQVLAQCIRAGRYIESGQLYKAFRVLEAVQKEHGAVLRAAADPRLALPLADVTGSAAGVGAGAPPPASARLLAGAATARGRGGSGGGAGAAASLAAKLGMLGPFLADKVRELTDALEQRALAEFNGWLVAVRTQARTIGMRAIRHAAAEREHEELLARQRKALLQQLPGTLSVREAAALVAAAMRAAAAAQAGAPPTPLPLAAQQGGGTPPHHGDLLEGLDMAPLHRCVHILACLGRLPHLQEYYATNRRQQLMADLALQGGGGGGAGASAAGFLESYQAYLTQVVGYFLVEDRVQQSAQELELGPQTAERPRVPRPPPPPPPPKVDGAWEAAVKTLKGLLESAFEGASAAAAMLTVKDFMLLVCLALGHCGYHTSAIREILVAGRGRYHDLLSAAAAVSVQAAVARDALQPVEVATQRKADELCRQLSLPATFKQEASADVPIKRPPFRAPFSAMVPDLARVIRGYIMDSVAYLKGLVTAGEVLPAAKQHRDRMLAAVVAPALQRRLDAAAAEPRTPLGTRLQLVANVAALIQAIIPLDDFALLQARGDKGTEQAASGRSSPERSASPSGASSPGARAPSPGGSEGRGASPDRAGSAEPRGSWRRGRRRSPGAGSSDSLGSGAPSPPGSPTAAVAQQQAGSGQQPGPGHSVLSVSVEGMDARGPSVPGAGGAPLASPGAAAAALQAVLDSAEALAMQAVAAKASPLLAQGERLDWTPEAQQRDVGAYSPYMEQLIMLLTECQSDMRRQVPAASAARMMAGTLRYVADALMLQLMSSDAIPTYNIFALQRLFADVGGLSRAAEAMGGPPLAACVTEPLLFCELMVFGTLEELLQASTAFSSCWLNCTSSGMAGCLDALALPDLRVGKYAALNLRRVVLILDKYRELDRASGFKSMHKSKQAERFISRKTVEGVAKQLREVLKSAPGGAAASRTTTG
eukprot:scaffold1.g5321.t1